MKESFVPMSPEQRHNEAKILKAKGVTPIDPFVIQMLGDYGFKAIYDRCWQEVKGMLPPKNYKM